jgi:hypothetical protein
VARRPWIWTPEMNDIVREAYAKRTRLADVAKTLGVTHAAVIGRATRLGLNKPAPIALAEVAQQQWRKEQFIANNKGRKRQ